MQPRTKLGSRKWTSHIFDLCLLRLPLILSLLFIVACSTEIGNPFSSNDSKKEPVVEPVQEPNPDIKDKSILSGFAIKGPISQGEIRVYQLLEDGSRGSLLGQTFSDTEGHFSLELETIGAVEIVVSDGQYVDEATGVITQMDQNQLRCLLTTAKQENDVAITPLTTMSAELTRSRLGSSLSETIVESNRQVAQVFNLQDVDISATIPNIKGDDPTKSSNASRYGAILIGLSEYVQKKNGDPSEVFALIDRYGQDLVAGNHDAISIDQTESGQEQQADNSPIGGSVNESSQSNEASLVTPLPGASRP